MILAVAVLAGLVAGLIRARRKGRPFLSMSLRSPWLVFLAFLPQFVIFYLPRAGVVVPDEWVPLILLTTQVALLVFAIINRKLSGFVILGFGLLLNFLVIALNGGLMPISPETVRVLYPSVPEDHWQVGERLGTGKDIVLPVEETRLWILSDRFVLPEWFHYPMAFSVGDVLLALGAFWALWALGGDRIGSWRESIQSIRHESQTATGSSMPEK